MRLEGVLRQELELTRSTILTSESLGQRTLRPSNIAWPKWNELHEVYVNDEAAARKSVRFLTSDEVLARYGPPEAARPTDKGTMWHYYDEGFAGEALSVTLRVLDGYVTDMWMEL